MHSPIGIFDSGIGGLTVIKELSRLLPHEQLIYFGDTARVPYGTKSKRLVQQYALEDAHFLLQYHVKMMVVACNSASASALPLLQQNLDIPVVGVVRPGAAAAATLTRNNKVGVIGTSATINSGAYAAEINRISKNINVFGQPCPLLVPLVEEGWVDDPITDMTIQKYLSDLLKKNIDTLILGCTHYPVLEQALAKIVGTQVQLIDSGRETAKVVKGMLAENKMLNAAVKQHEDRFFVSDNPSKFEQVGSRFLGKPIKNVERVDFDQFLVHSGFSQKVNLQEE